MSDTQRGGIVHCPTCMCDRRARFQSYEWGVRAHGTISWAEHLECYTAYAVRHSGQSAERIDERGGFGWDEFVKLTGHEPESWRAL